MSGFDKIEFIPKKSNSSMAGSQSVAKKDLKNTVSMPKKKASKFRVNKKVGIALGIFLLLIIVFAIPAFATYQSGIKTYRQAKILGAALKTQNIEQASIEVDKTKASLKDTQRNFGYLFALRFVPIVNWYYNDADHMLKAGSHGLDTAEIAIEALKPHADVLGLKGEGSFTGGSAEERIKTVVMAAGQITPEIDKIGESLEAAQKEMNQVGEWHYPSWLFGKKIHNNLATAKQTTDQAATFITEAKPLVKALPDLLGEKEEKKYLVLFQNDKELRSTGGFLTGYALFRVDKGVIHPDNNDDIYPLDATISNKPKAPDALAKYLKVSQLNLRDSNISPDYIESMKTFREMYESSPRKAEVDGIIAIDTDVLVNTVKILDNTITAGGMTFTTDIDPRCDCPQIIYELENNISRPVNYVKTDRKSILGDLLNAILVKALSSSPKKYWGPLFQSLITQANEKHILFYLYDEEAQKGVEALNAAGRIKDTDGDYLHINESNLSGAKVNIFMEENVENSYDIKSDGTIEKTVTINYKNPFPGSDCNLERGNLCLNAEYKDWIRIYVPKGSELIDSKGAAAKVETSEDLNKTVFESLVRVRPQGTATYSITYKLPFKMEKNKLPLLIQKQPGTGEFEYKNVVNGKTQKTFPLNTDKEFVIKK